MLYLLAFCQSYPLIRWSPIFATQLKNMKPLAGLIFLLLSSVLGSAQKMTVSQIRLK